MIASIQCADGARVLIGDRVWLNNEHRCEVLGIGPGVVLVRTACNEPLVTPPIQLRTNQTHVTIYVK